MPSSTRVYHSVLHIGDYVHLSGDYNNYHLCLYQISLKDELLTHLSMAALCSVVHKLPTNATTSFFVIVGFWTLFTELGFKLGLGFYFWTYCFCSSYPKFLKAFLGRTLKRASGRGGAKTPWGVRNKTRLLKGVHLFQWGMTEARFDHAFYAPRRRRMLCGSWCGHEQKLKKKNPK